MKRRGPKDSPLLLFGLGKLNLHSKTTMNINY
jgi:hypothetical protein